MTAVLQEARPTTESRVRLLRPVLTTLLVAGALHVGWVLLLANSGGDIAAQDAWAEFARTHPGSAYNFSWYGGMHTASYSLVSPFVMAAIGVRTTMVLAGTLSAGLLSLLLVRTGAVSRPMVASLVGAVSLLGNAVSGRVTFGLGLAFGLGALAVVFAWPDRLRAAEPRYRLPRGALAALLAALATASSPVAGLFLGIAAAGLWLGHRHSAAYALGLPPVAVVGLSTLAFPFSGHQPIHWNSVVLPVLLGVVVALTAPRAWRTVRLGAVVYAAGVVLTWLVPSPIGTNVGRLALIFGGVLLVAILTSGGRRRTRAVTLVLALLTSGSWQVATAARDVVTTAPDAAWSADLGALVRQLRQRDAGQGRVEVVPPKSHRDAAALAPYFNLARGWNRQTDAERNPLFYDSDVPLTADSYRTWLDRWAVHYVVLSPGRPDDAAVEEAALVSGGLPYLTPVWSNASWQLYEVTDPTPIVAPPARVLTLGDDEVTLEIPSAGSVLVRIPASPWLTLVDAAGDPLPIERGCLSVRADPGPPEDDWVVVVAPSAGVYRITAPYSLRRGTPCPDDG
ncbi:MFS transporter [Nocardioides sp.]|uniref:MFS transporter n=1 Tax=Nocardioides sp. TaxID=35761 RepID=UPI0039E3FDC8